MLSPSLRRVGLLSALAIALASCSPPAPLPPLPEGPQTLSGTVIPTTISATQRGTHALTRSAETVVYLRSGTVNLRELQGRSVTLRGYYEANIDPSDLPVLVVENVLNAEETTRAWTSEALKLSASIPTRWGVAGTNFVVEFIPAGALRAVVTIVEREETPIPSGLSMTVGGAQAVRFMDEISGEQRIAIPRGTGYLELAFTPQGSDDLSQLRAEWTAFLHSVRIQGARTTSRPSGSMSSTSGALEGQPCGGPAGILCPGGQYCEITDLENSIGVCRRIEP